ncbi:PP2C family protein-serine/threonine phosphatase [Streptomyces sp. NPDC004546]|uniref:PP2C family protein-serine/threonine phosphatase n=1 Tax=Streptomyces sp. NPDC004546 TaxID=3154282 RepID=UPI0033B55439
MPVLRSGTWLTKARRRWRRHRRHARQAGQRPARTETTMSSMGGFHDLAAATRSRGDRVAAGGHMHHTATVCVRGGGVTRTTAYIRPASSFAARLGSAPTRRPVRGAPDYMCPAAPGTRTGEPMSRGEDVDEQGRDAAGRRLLGDLIADSHLMSMEEISGVVIERAAAAGFPEVLIYLGDLQRRVLRLVTGYGFSGEGYEGELQVEGTVPGRCYQYGKIIAAAPDGAEWWVPLMNGTERLGVLRITSTYADERACQDAVWLSDLVALLIVTKRDVSDAMARLTRSEPLNIAAEMQWHLMPPSTYTDRRVMIAASMEPAYQISGDAYDYATDGPQVHLSIFDAMGHDLAAGLTAHLAMGACRNARRQGADLAANTEAVEAALIEQYDRSRYATGILASLDTRDGAMRWVNRGHPPPVLIRGGRWHTHLHCPPAAPMGTGLDLKTTVCREQLEPGDRVVFYTDGITEARGSDGTEFGLERFTDFLIRHHADDLPVAETLRRLIYAVLQHHGGRLQDDATVLLCEWLGPATAGRYEEAVRLAGLPERTGFDPHGPEADLRRSTPS